MREGLALTIKELNMPQLGESVTEGTINSWLVSEGDYVNKYDPICEVMSDKVNAEVPSSYSGVIQEIVAKEGDVVEAGHLICYIKTDEATKQNDPQEEELPEKKTVNNQKVDAQSMKTRYSPAVIRLATEHGIELSEVTGTGLNGRITRKDILAFIEPEPIKNENTEPQREQQEFFESDHEPLDESSYNRQESDIEIPMTGVRKAIAHKMTQSKREIPHAWMMIEVDVTGLVDYRDNIKDTFLQNEGYNLTYFPFFVNVIAKALREYPKLNSTWAAGKIIQRRDINLSIAVAKDDELYVPVIKNADEKSIKGIAKEINTLATKVRAGKASPEMMQDGTFTVNNTGSFGSIQSQGIINHPQAAILQVESIVKRPVIIDDMFAARDIVNLCLSFDHRILDGLISGKFLARVKEMLENIDINTTNVY